MGRWQIRQYLTEAGVNPNKHLGQHFLIDLNLMRLLIDTAGITDRDIVLEVGCGTGSLTEALSDRAGAVVTVEIDPTLATIALKNLQSRPNVQLVHADALHNKNTINPEVIEALTRAAGISPSHQIRVNPCESVSEEEPCESVSSPLVHHPSSIVHRLLLVANLPYQVASPLMINLITGPTIAHGMYVTVQKEVADRMTASPGGSDYGLLSVLLSATGTVRTLRTLKPSVFWPPPQVDSAMVAFVREPERACRISDMTLFTDILALFLGHRRKMLKAASKLALGRLAGIDDWPGIFESCEIDPSLRPDQISPDDYIALTNTCQNRLQSP